jgi:hypothetical protein
MMANDWRIERRVPVAVIIAILSAIGGGIWSMATLFNQVEELQKSVLAIPEIKRDVDSIDRTLTSLIRVLNDRDARRHADTVPIPPNR